MSPAEEFHFDSEPIICLMSDHLTLARATLEREGNKGSAEVAAPTVRAVLRILEDAERAAEELETRFHETTSAMRAA